MTDPTQQSSTPITAEGAVSRAMQLALEALAVATTPLPEDRQAVLLAQTALRDALSSQPAGEAIGWLYDWTHSSALGKPDEHFTGFTTKREDAFRPTNENQRQVYLRAPQDAKAEQSICAKAGDGLHVLSGNECLFCDYSAPAASNVEALSESLPQEFDADLWAAVAQGWCEPGQTHKVMDSDLAIAIVRNVQRALKSRQSAPIEAGELRTLPPLPEPHWVKTQSYTADQMHQHAMDCVTTRLAAVQKVLREVGAPRENADGTRMHHLDRIRAIATKPASTAPATGSIRSKEFDILLDTYVNASMDHQEDRGSWDDAHAAHNALIAHIDARQSVAAPSVSWDYATMGLPNEEVAELWRASGHSGVVPFSFANRIQERLHSAHGKASDAEDELARIKRLAACGTVDSFMALPDDDKRYWFAMAWQESDMRKLAEERLHFLHSTNTDAEGWEWGVARVRNVDGRVEYLWGLSDHSDIDAARAQQQGQGDAK